ncbi:hypothetical protein MWU49_12565 [Alcanivorax sp. S6407]|uniref:hypothetical protein n=1 Tax=Alcanivorax sp. S6407 TaxID=2926424 RepID=UPI001FF67939|nr:hypothetical protein [Alcanivorax sp. S6407]MCK0154543.1 hypothetical protein [Alcanivorax sp. S6407]
MKKLLFVIGLLPAFALADQVIEDALIVSGNTCLGQDCNLNQNFAYAPLELKENNLRIRLTDIGSPTQDVSVIGPDYTIPASLGDSWSIVANDSSSGGDGYLSIEQHQDPSLRLSDGTATDYTCVHKDFGYPVMGEAAKDYMTVTVEDTPIPEGAPWEDQWCATRSETVVRNGIRFTVGSTTTNGGVSIGFDSENAEGTVSVGNDSKLRRLANLADALSDVDVLTVAQMDVYAEQKAALAALDAKLDNIERAISAIENPRSSGGSLPATLLTTLAGLLLFRRRR